MTPHVASIVEFTMSRWDNSQRVNKTQALLGIPRSNTIPFDQTITTSSRSGDNGKRRRQRGLNVRNVGSTSQSGNEEEIQVDLIDRSTAKTTVIDQLKKVKILVD